MKKDEELKQEVLKNVENKKYTKQEIRGKLENFSSTLEVNKIVDREKVEEYTFLNKKYKCKKENIYAGEIENNKNGTDKVKLIINRIKITDYFNNKKIKSVKKLCPQNVLRAQGNIYKVRKYGKKNYGILKNLYGKSITFKNTVNKILKIDSNDDFFKKGKKIKFIKCLCPQNDFRAQHIFIKYRKNEDYKNGILKNLYGKSITIKKTVFGFRHYNLKTKTSRKEIKAKSDFYKNKFLNYIEDSYLKNIDEDEKIDILNNLKNNVLASTNKKGITKNFTFKPCDFNIFNGYSNFNLYGKNLNEILEKCNDFNLIISADTEFMNVVGTRNKEECVLLSTQFAFYWSGYIYTFTFLVNKIYSTKLSLKVFLQHILKYIDSKLFKINNRDKKCKNRLRVTLLHHFARADLQHYKEFNTVFYKGLALEIQSGIDSIRPLTIDIKYQNRVDRKELEYSISLNLRDTMCYCIDNKSLANQTKEQLFKKIDSVNMNKNDMISYLINNTKEFLDYADMDSICTLELGYKMWGFNVPYPLSVGQSSVSDFINVEMEKVFGTTFENCRNIFKFLYNGSFKGNIVSKEKESGGIESKDIFTNVNINITNILHYYANCFYGGLNQCYSRGFYNGLTYDFDLVSAYPTFMSCVPKANMLLTPVEYNNISPNVALSLLFDKKEFNLACAIVDYDFSLAMNRYKNHSCIPQKVNDNLVFTTSGKNVLVCGAELYRALEVCAVTKVKKLIIPKYVEGDSTFKDFYKKTIKIRNLYKKIYGKKSIQQNNIKFKNNSLFGKTGQSLNNSKINRYINNIETKDNMPPSEVTNPIYASVITSLVRCYLNDIIALLNENGFAIHSVTTDGFISNAPFEILDSISKTDEFIKDFTNRILNVAGEIQDNKLDSLWEIKHSNDSLFNLTTRGNFAVNIEGVLACAGSKLLKKFKYRNTILHYLFKNNGKCNEKYLKLSSVKEMLLKNEALTGVYIHKGDFFLEFDGKNIPILDTVNVVDLKLKNLNYQILNFKTRQPKNVEEFTLLKGLLKKYKNATYDKNKFYKLMQEFNSADNIKEIKKNINISRSTKNLEYVIVKNFLTNYLNNKLNPTVKNFLDFYSRQEIIEFLNINFLKYNDKKLTKNVYENIQKQIKKNVTDKLENGDIEIKVLEFIKSQKKGV